MEYLLIFALGGIAGFINALAGGGSALPLGLMILMGIESPVANGTNRVGVFSAALASSRTFLRQKNISFHRIIPAIIPVLPGAVLGALFAAKIDHEPFTRIISAVLFFIVISLFIPHKTIFAHLSHHIRPGISTLLLFCIGLYGGFIQVGVGYVLMGFFSHIKGMDLVTTNACKTTVIMFYTIPAVVIFSLTGRIDWTYAVLLALGEYAGGKISSRLAIHHGEKIIKPVLAVSLGIICLQLVRT
jgi:uncharacterized membrane protein YfcA